MLNRSALGGIFNSLGFGKRYAVGSNRSRTGPVPPDPDQAARYFQPLAVEPEEWETPASLARQKRAQRLLRPVAQRRMAATLWVAGRKFTRLHRALPLPVVALVYLLIAGGLCYLVARPLLQPVPTTANPLPLPEAAKPDFAASVAEISRLISAKDFSAAAEKLKNLEARYPGDARVVMTQGAILAGERKYPEAHAAFSRALELSPTSNAARMNLAEIEFVMERYAEARTLYLKVLKFDPKNPLVVFRLYLCARMEGDTVAAAEYFASPTLGQHTLESYYIQAADDLFSGRKEQAHKTLNTARLLFGAKALPYDRTLARMKLIDPVD